MTKPFTTLTAVAAPLPRESVDTDTIIRVEPLFGGVPRDELGRFALATWRYREDGSDDPDFILNQGVYRSAGILVAGANFGCGSSREGAVWALMAAGLRCIIAPSFGDIFHANCFQNGLLPIRLPSAQVTMLSNLVAVEATSTLTIDLFACTVEGHGVAPLSFDLPARRREGLLKGLDDLELTLGMEAQIETFQRADKAMRPWIYLPSDPQAIRLGSDPSRSAE
jgi:3-isopropylmalate/(R)-2-methylmalate dehydratase small subunit